MKIGMLPEEIKNPEQLSKVTHGQSVAGPSPNREDQVFLTSHDVSRMYPKYYRISTEDKTRFG